MRDSERSARIALRAALKDPAWLGASASRKRGRDEDSEGPKVVVFVFFSHPGQHETTPR